jgi:hypothetical protein
VFVSAREHTVVRCLVPGSPGQAGIDCEWTAPKTQKASSSRECLPPPLRPPTGSHNHPFSSHPAAQDTLEKSAFVAQCLKRKKELGAAWPDRYVTPHTPLRPCDYDSPSRYLFPRNVPPHGQRQGPHDGGDGDAAGQVSKEGRNSYRVAFVHSIRWTVKLSLISLVRQLVDPVVVDIEVFVLLVWSQGKHVTVTF